MSERRHPRRFPVALAAALVAAAGLLGAPPPAAASDTDEEDVPCQRDAPDPQEPPVFSDPPGATYGPLQLERAHEISRGKGVGVAVIDSGVAAGGLVDVRPGHRLPRTRPGRPLDNHGTLVAGLIAGSGERITGVAPGAHVVPIRVLDAGQEVAEDDEGLATLSPQAVAAGIRQAIRLSGVRNIRVINLSLEIHGHHPAVAKAVDAALAQGIVVVASVGNRQRDESGNVPEEAQYEVGEQQVRFPATYPGVLGVTALAPDLTLDPQYVWTGTGTDVSAPVYGALTTMAGGSTCVIQDVGSSWAAAQASGLAALILAQQPDLTPAEVVTRIEATASGAYRDQALDGHGMIQPVEALTAELSIGPDGELRRPEHVEPSPRSAQLPDLGDPRAASRAALLWWGIGAGSLVLLALLARPLVAWMRR